MNGLQNALKILAQLSPAAVLITAGVAVGIVIANVFSHQQLGGHPEMEERMDQMETRVFILEFRMNEEHPRKPNM